MSKLLTICLSVLLLTGFKSQTFTGSGGTIPNNGVPTYFPLSVSGLGGVLDNNLGLTEVCLNITHPDMSEITIALVSPAGVMVELVNSTSIKGSNFSGTCFNSTSGTPISNSNAPYTASLKPTGYLGRFNNGKSGNGNWSIVVKDWNVNGNSGTLGTWSLKFGPSAPSQVNITSSNLPLVFINTNGAALGTNSIVADFGIVANGAARNNVTDPRNNYNGKAKINVRGSSSQIFEKKSIKVDLCQTDGVTPVDFSILGMAPESDWVLAPGYSDKTLIRNALSQHLFRMTGHYSPHTRYVELFINDEYFGVYTLLEKPKRNSQRINVGKMLPTDNSYPFITGGYVIQINRTQDPGWYSLFPGVSASSTPPKFYYQYEYPRAEDITQPQKDYIKAVMDTFETVMNGPNFADPNTGYRKYIDVTSFVDFLILQEFCKNPDGYNLSTYLYKDNIKDGGKLHIGPVWDFDIAWHNANYGNSDVEQWWHYEQAADAYPIPTWWMKFMQDPYFKDQLYCRWHTFRKNAFSNSSINSFIDESVTTLAEAQVRNFQQFPILDTYIFPNPPAQIGTYQGAVADLKNWVSIRGAWMDQYIPGFCNNVSLEEFAGKDIHFTSFPNPFTRSFSVLYALDGASDVSMELTDLTGRTILRTAETTENAGEHNVEISSENLPYGVYLLKLNVNKNIFYRKIIKAEGQ